MAARYKSVTVRPANGGQLLTRASSGDAGVANYTVKRDWRRDLNDEVRREGYDYFAPDAATVVAGYLMTEDGQLIQTEDGQNIELEGLDTGSGGVGNQPFPLTANPDDVGPINLIIQARRQNGLKTILVGTQTSLYRFVGGDGLGVCEAGVCEDGVLVDNYADWALVGTGFWAPNGWQAVNLNGFLVLNNGNDLPMTFRVEDSGVRPIYELRESSVAKVGGISAVSGVLICHDIHEIPDESMLSLFERRGVRRADNVLASVQAGSPQGTVVATSEVFGVNDAGRTVELEDGTQLIIENVLDGYTAKVGSVTDDLDPQSFIIKTRASQTGSTFSGDVLATVAAGSRSVTSDAAFFDPAHVGKWVRFYNGWSGQITSFITPWLVELDPAGDAAPDSVISPVHLLTTTASAPGSPEYTVTAVADVFTEDMVGSQLVFDSGNPRLILEYISQTQVRVDSDLAQELDEIGVENPATYARYSGLSNRVAYRAIWAMQDQPRRWAAAVAGSIDAESGVLVLSQPAKSIEAGMSLSIAGAGTSGSNLVAEVLFVEANQFIGLSESAVLSVDGELVQAADSIGSIVSYEDLEADGTPIRAAAPLKGVWVAYKDSAVFLGRFTGNSTQPFEFTRREITEAAGLFYLRTLVNVDGQFHVYAARNGFYRFDLSMQAPMLLESAEYCKDLFFDYAHRDPASVFAAYNPLTREAMFWSGSDTEDRALCLDYIKGTWSTTSIHATAGAAVSRPDAEDDHQWFLMAVGPTVTVYGKSDKPTWGSRSSIYYRRSAYPYHNTAFDYTSTMQSGVDDFGNLHAEKDIRAIVPTISSKSEGHPVTLTLWGGRNPGEEAVLATAYFNCRTQNLVPVHFRKHYFGWGLSASQGQDVRYSSLTLDISGVMSDSHVRSGGGA